jgi:hypothetical protein
MASRSPSGEKKMLPQFAGAVRKGVVFPSRSIQWMGALKPALCPGRYTSVPLSENAN